MHLQLTMTLFAALTAALILVRVAWSRFPHRLQRALFITAFIALPIWPLSAFTSWNTTSDRLNGLIYWAFIAAYELLLLLFTLIRPRWFTALIAFTLIAPILSASAFLPLTDIFDRAPQPSIHLGDHLYSQLVPWTYFHATGSGTDLEIYYRPPWLPFLQHRSQGVRYYNTQCDAARAFAVLQPDHKHLQVNCPAQPSQPPNTARSLIVRLH